VSIFYMYVYIIYTHISCGSYVRIRDLFLVIIHIIQFEFLLSNFFEKVKV